MLTSCLPQVDIQRIIAAVKGIPIMTGTIE
jgi:hypothetical protein